MPSKRPRAIAGATRVTWTDELRSAYVQGTHHCFCVTGNIRDVGENNAREVLASMGEHNMEITLVWDKAGGFKVLGNDKVKAWFKEKFLTPPGVPPEMAPEPEDVTQVGPAFAAISGVLARSKIGTDPYKAMVIIDFADSVLPDAPMAQLSEHDRTAVVTAQKWARDRDIANRGHILVLLARSLHDLHTDVRSAATHYRTIQVHYPNVDERLAFLQERAATEMGLPLEPGLTAEELANTTSGMNLLQIDDLVMAGQALGGVTRQLVRKTKDAVLLGEYGDVLEPMYPRWGFEAVGGLEHIVEFMRRNIVEPMRTGNWQRVPMGVLEMGPPGTGKTVMTEATAKEAGINSVYLRLSKILGKYVGESERNLEKALDAIETMTPCLVFVDELDQQFSRGTGHEGDSGVSNRLFGRVMEFAADTSHRGRVVVIAATNRPDLLDAAIKRPGRFDKKVVFLPPSTAAQRSEIVAAMGRKYTCDTSAFVATDIAGATAGWTGAELEALTLKTLELAQDDDREFPGVPDWELAFDLYLPSTQEIERQVTLALREVNDLSLVPAEYRNRVRELRRAPAQEDGDRSESATTRQRSLV